MIFKTLSLIDVLYSNDYCFLDIVINRDISLTTWQKKNHGFVLRVVGTHYEEIDAGEFTYPNTLGTKVILHEVFGFDFYDALCALSRAVSKKCEDKIQLKKKEAIKERETKFLKNIYDDVEFWKKAKAADTEAEGKSEKIQTATGKISKKEFYELGKTVFGDVALTDKQLSFPFMEKAEEKEILPSKATHQNDDYAPIIKETK